ncbi:MULTISPECIES: HDIG domain-containing metalloprotein [Cyanophyceae]|uniref:HD family phosphohydrolase n=1 Tax=Cyanophyceae TaxID=3028117 RepID=UPI001F550DE6|nr:MULTISPECIES: HDIG domain-containing metalloprotein [Cyanophyceae]
MSQFMKAIQDIVAAIERWWALEQQAMKPTALRSTLSPRSLSLTVDSVDAEAIATSTQRRMAAWPQPCRPLRRRKNIRHPRFAFAIATLGLTTILGQRFYNQPGLQVGSIAPNTVLAPSAVRVEDKETTEERRRDARNGALRVLRVDPAVDDSVLRSLNALMDQVGDIRRQAGGVPFVATNKLSTQVQIYLRRSDDATWLKLRSLIDPLADDSARGEQMPLATLLRNQTITPDQQTALGELWAYGQRSSSQELAKLLTAVEKSRQSYQEAMANLTLLAAQSEGVAEAPPLFDLPVQDWVSAQAEIRQAAERMLAQGIHAGLPREMLDRAAHLQLKDNLPRPIEPLARQLLLSALEPNLVEDSDRTRQQADMAAEAVKPVIVEAQQGELIVSAGEPISQGQFVLLDSFNLSQRRFNHWGLAMFGGLVAGGVGLFLLVEHWIPQRLRQKDYLLLSAMVVSTGVMQVFGIAAYGLPAIGLLAGSFYGPVLGGTLVVLVAVLLPVGSAVSSISFMAGAAGALVCSLLASRMRSREELALLGGGVGLTQGVVYLLLTLVVSPVSLISAWSVMLTGAALQGIYGVISSIAAQGLSPYLEHLFDLVTPIRLAELSSPNRPMLKRLASEAPGTFQHTVFVSSLAEAAARALGCNVELVRAGTLYHDIGKIHDPQGFIENQMGGPNKHDELNDPWLSATIIKKHVTEGIVMARKCRLPKAVRSFIPEHQGTMLISYFYHQAQELAKEEPTLVVQEADFRYDGPIPQSPETGIVMLADSCEAALRSLTNATPDEALAMVNRILRARWKDNQLVESGLTRDHMTLIAEIFVQVWQQYNHKRIAYPKAALAPNAG